MKIALTIGRQPDRADQAAQNLDRLVAGNLVLVQCFRQCRDLAAVDVAQTRVKPERFLFTELAQFVPDRNLAGLQSRHLLLHRRVIHAVGNRIDNLGNGLLDLRQFCLACRADSEIGLHGLVVFPLVFLDEGGDEVRMEELVAQAAQNAVFQAVAMDHAAIVAGTLVAGAGAAVMLAADERVCAATTAAGEKAGEKIAGAACALGAKRPVFRFHDAARDALALLDGIPERLFEDAKLRHLLDHPFRLRIGAGLPLAGLRVLHEMLPVPDHPANVEFIVEDAGPASPVAVDGGGTPRCARRAGNTVFVQAGGDGAWADPACIVAENATDDSGLVVVDSALAGCESAVRQRLANDLVSIGDAADGLAVADTTLEAAMRLLGEILEEEGRHRALQADMQLGDLALGHGDDGNAEIAQLFVEGGDVFLVAGEAVEAFGDEDIELPGAGIHHHRLIGGAQVRAAAEALICMELCFAPATLVDEAAADAMLILDGSLAL